MDVVGGGMGLVGWIEYIILYYSAARINLGLLHHATPHIQYRTHYIDHTTHIYTHYVSYITMLDHISHSIYDIIIIVVVIHSLQYL